MSDSKIKTKLKDLSGMKVAIDNIVAQAWERGYKYGLYEAKQSNNSTRPQGEWIKIFETPFTNGYICSLCGHKIQVTDQFLPKVTECEGCGAEMKGEE